MKKDLKLLLGDRDCVFGLVLPLVLLPTEVDVVPKKGYYKGNTVETLGPGGSKVILTLLTKVIAFHVRLTTIDVR